jgi:hypothetical protein
MLGCNSIREVGGQRRVSRQLTNGQLYPPPLINGQLYRVCGSSGCPRS